MKFRHFCDGDRIKRTVEVFSVLKILMLELLTFAILFIKNVWRKWESSSCINLR